MTEAEEEIKTLHQEDAIVLFKKGKEAWNKWVEENPRYNVNFSGVDFSELRDEDGVLRLNAFLFPTGNVDFAGARFGDGTVDFCKVLFGEGDVDFRSARFGTGSLDFSEARFGDGNIDFSRVQFGNGNVDFSETQFGDGEVSFVHTKFGKGDVYFSEAQFGRGNVDFLAVQFGKGDVDFRDTQFGEGDVSFFRAQFGNGNVDFSYTHFGEGHVIFTRAQFGEVKVEFDKAYFSGHMDFSDLRNAGGVSLLSFRGATFEKTMDISGNSFACVPDLTNTKTTNQVSLDKFLCRYSQEMVTEYLFGRWYVIDERATDKDDTHRLRRLKELTEANKNHTQALQLYAMEKRAARWQSGTSKWDNLIDFAYDKISDYGRSEITPLKYLIVVWLVFNSFFMYASWLHKGFIWQNYIDSAVFSSGQVFPFIQSARIARNLGVDNLFNGEPPWYVFVLMYSESVISLALIFLIGLALRNRFRI